MLDLNKLKKSKFFKQRTLEKKEYLFYEGDIDENIYIIELGKLAIEKFTDINKTKTKTLAILEQNDIFGEASLNNNLPKQVSIRAKEKTSLIYIKASDIENYAKEKDNQVFNLLKYIIFLGNKRLNLANELITASYTISEEIINLKDFSYKTIFKLIDRIKEITKIDEEIMYLEQNPILEEYFTLKYRTSIPGKMQDKIIKFTDNKLDLLNLKIGNKFSYSQKLQIGDKNYGYLIFIRKNREFDSNEIKIFATLSTSFAGVLKQKEFLKEEANKQYLNY